MGQLLENRKSRIQNRVTTSIFRNNMRRDFTERDVRWRVEEVLETDTLLRKSLWVGQFVSVIHRETFNLIKDGEENR